MSELAASRSVAQLLQASVGRLDGRDAASTRHFLTALQSLPTFIFEVARTLDEHDATPQTSAAGNILPGKPFPDWPFLHEILDEYADNRLLLIEKARQLMVTWLIAAVVVWEVRHAPGQRWGWISLKADHADAALERMWQVIIRLPGKMEKTAVGGHMGFRDAGGVLWTRSYGHIAIPSMTANIHGMSQEANDCRSFTMSGLVFDEWAFQPAAKSAYSAAKPTIDGGRVVGITTPGPFGFIHDLYRGKDFGADDE